mmetsp:Transcript_36010/g.94638  ORF Transcript_36010/g.94638 Transcript_36010/m.94638 type:complete len:144 (+) Transcript_36010:175-606(+)
MSGLDVDPDSFLPRIPRSKDEDHGGSKVYDPVGVGEMGYFAPLNCMLIFKTTGLVKVKQCGLCGLEFEEHNLPGIVSFQAIANLRKRYLHFLRQFRTKLTKSCRLGCEIPASDARLRSASSKYSSVKLCAFCYQFFYDDLDGM